MSTQEIVTLVVTLLIGLAAFVGTSLVGVLVWIAKEYLAAQEERSRKHEEWLAKHGETHAEIDKRLTQFGELRGRFEEDHRLIRSHEAKMSAIETRAEIALARHDSPAPQGMGSGRHKP